MAQPQDIKTSLVAVVGVIGAILVFAIIVLLMVVFYQVRSQQEYQKYISRPAPEWTNLTTRQKEMLASYGWIDQEKGTVHVPIGRAMEIVVKELSEQQAHAGSAQEGGNDGQ